MWPVRLETDRQGGMCCCYRAKAAKHGEGGMDDDGDDDDEEGDGFDSLVDCPGADDDEVSTQQQTCNKGWYIMEGGLVGCSM